VSLGIRFTSAQELADAELLDFFTRQCDAELIDFDPRDPFLRTPGMDITTYAVSPVDEDQAEEEDWHAAKLGFWRRSIADFRVRGVASLEDKLAGWEVMLNAVIAFVRKYPGEAALVFNGEEILMRYREGEIMFDTSEYFDEELSLATIVSRHRQEQLEQPLMG
jgi:hypothetical protein